MSASTRGGLLGRLRRRRDTGTEGRPGELPDPAKAPRNRGPWEEAALTNVDITEVVKREINSRTQPWQK